MSSQNKKLLKVTIAEFTIGGASALIMGGVLLSILFIQPTFTVNDLFITLGGLGFTGFGIYTLNKAYHRRNDHIWIWDDRLVSFQKGVKKTVYWKDIAYLWQDLAIVKLSISDISGTPRCRFTIELVDGTELFIDEYFKSSYILANIFKQTTIPRLLKEAELALLQDEFVEFDLFAVDSEGIEFDEENFIAWSEIKDIRATKGYLHMDIQQARHSYTYSIATSEIANVAVFLILAKKRGYSL